jgi:hypothetical protein
MFVPVRLIIPVDKYAGRDRGHARSVDGQELGVETVRAGSALAGATNIAAALRNHAHNATRPLRLLMII